MKQLRTFIKERLIWFRPVILIATANDYDEAFLVHLEQERRHIKNALRWANLRSRFNKLVLLKNATGKDVLRALERYQGRIVIFQYSGHAHSDKLQLEDGQLALRNIARKLETEDKLQLVVLNGCYSDSSEAQQLYANHGCDLITTNDRIQDTVATEFTSLLYKSLSQGADGESAFKACQQQLDTDFERDGVFRDLEDGDGEKDSNETISIPSTSAWTWQFYKGSKAFSKGLTSFAWRLKRLVWLPVVLAWCICLSSTVFAWQWFSYQDKREPQDRGIVLTRMVPQSITPDAWRLVKNRLRAALNSDLDVQTYDYHIYISDTYLEPDSNDGVGEDCHSLGLSTELLLKVAKKHRSDLVIFFRTLEETTENITVQPFLYGTDRSAAAEYLRGCQAFADTFEIALPITEEAIGSLIKERLRPRIEALAHFLDAVRKYEEPTLGIEGMTQEDSLQLIVDSLRESIWSEVVLNDFSDVQGKESLYYFVAGYLSNHVQYRNDVQIACPVKYAKPVFEAYEVSALDCAEELLRRVRAINPDYERERLGEANIHLARGVNLARLEHEDACKHIGRAFNAYMLLGSSLSEQLNKLQAQYATANATYKLLEYDCSPTFPQSLAELFINNLNTITEVFESDSVEGLSLQSALRASIQKGLWQLVDVFESNEDYQESILKAQQSFEYAWQLGQVLDDSPASQSVRKEIIVYQGMTYMTLASIDVEAQKHLDLAKNTFLKSIKFIPTSTYENAGSPSNLDLQVSDCLENIEKIENNNNLSQDLGSDVTCVNLDKS